MGGATPNANSLRQQPTSASVVNDLANKGPLQGWPLRPPQANQPQQQQPLKDTMPLSPPLTPLPASIGRFPQMPMLGAHNMLGPYHHLLLAAQYGQAAQNPFLPRPPLMPNANGQLSLEFMEQLQRLIQLRNLGSNGSNVSNSNERKTPSVNTNEETPNEKQTVHNNNNNINNNNHVVKHEAETETEVLKREEEMVDDEMKQEEDVIEEDELDDSEELVDPIEQVPMKCSDNSSEHKIDPSSIGTSTTPKATEEEQQSSPPNLTDSLKQLQLNWLKKMYDDLNKNKHQSPAPSDNVLPCNFQVGKNLLSNSVELAQESCNNNEDNQYEESLMSDTNEADFANGLNTSNSSGDERKVRVRTLISDEQLSILKTFYNHNPRPKREELERISSKIGHPFKVVKVWFQNSRARDRREGKPVVNQPPNPLGNGPAAAALPFFMNGGAAGADFRYGVK